MFFNKAINTVDKGKYTEQLACNHITEYGLSVVTKNYHSQRGEIDIIAKDNDTYVFIEVKYRKKNSFGGAISAVSLSKQEKIRGCASFFLQQQQLNEYNTSCRFDIIALDGDISKPQISWLKNAF